MGAPEPCFATEKDIDSQKASTSRSWWEKKSPGESLGYVLVAFQRRIPAKSALDRVSCFPTDTDTDTDTGTVFSIGEFDCSTRENSLRSHQAITSIPRIGRRGCP